MLDFFLSVTVIRIPSTESRYYHDQLGALSVLLDQTLESRVQHRLEKGTLFNFHVWSRMFQKILASINSSTLEPAAHSHEPIFMSEILVGALTEDEDAAETDRAAFSGAMRLFSTVTASMASQTDDRGHVQDIMGVLTAGCYQMVAVLSLTRWMMKTLENSAAISHGQPVLDRVVTNLLRDIAALRTAMTLRMPCTAHLQAETTTDDTRAAIPCTICLGDHDQHGNLKVRLPVPPLVDDETTPQGRKVNFFGSVKKMLRRGAQSMRKTFAQWVGITYPCVWPGAIQLSQRIDLDAQALEAVNLFFKLLRDPTCTMRGLALMRQKIVRNTLLGIEPTLRRLQTQCVVCLGACTQMSSYNKVTVLHMHCLHTMCDVCFLNARLSSTADLEAVDKQLPHPAGLVSQEVATYSVLFCPVCRVALVCQDALDDGTCFTQPPTRDADTVVSPALAAYASSLQAHIHPHTLQLLSEPAALVVEARLTHPAAERVQLPPPSRTPPPVKPRRQPGASTQPKPVLPPVQPAPGHQGYSKS